MISHSNIKIVNYTTEDYDGVMQIFKSGCYERISYGIRQGWKKPRVALFLSTSLLLIPISIKYALICLILLWCFHAYCVYRIYHGAYSFRMNTDMKDRELKFWTTPPNAYLLAKVNDTVVGMVSFQHINEQMAELNRMAVHIQYRRLGIAKMLTEDLIQLLKKQGYKKVVATTTSNQVGAHRFYENLGFVNTRIIYFGSFWADYCSGMYILEYIYDLV